MLSEPPVFSLSPTIAGEFLARVKPAVGKALDSGEPGSAVDAFFTIIDPVFWASAPDNRKQAYREKLPAMLADLQMPMYQLTTVDLARIDRPCLVLYGSASLPRFQQIAKIVAGAIPDCRLKELVGAGHATYATRPADFANAVRDFATPA
ncbi:MAG TPA: alpha/beta hydrolase [Propionicimonas sp.]